MSLGPEPLRVFERRLGGPRALGLASLALLAAAALWVSFEYQAQLARWIEVLGQPFGLQRTDLARVALALAPLAALVALVVRASRRTGRCAVDEDLLVFEPGLWPAWLARTVIAPDEVAERAPVAGGVRVRARGLSAAAPALLVPTDGGAPERARAGLAGGTQCGSGDDDSSREAGERSRRTHHTDGPGDLEAALAHLDRRPEPPVLRAGHASTPGWVAALGLVFVALVLVALALVPLLVTRRFDGQWAIHAAIGVVLVGLAVTPCLAAFAPWTRRVFVGRRRLVVGEEVFDYDEVTAVGLGDGFLACAAGRRTCLARVEEGEAALRGAIAARLAERGRAPDEIMGPLPPAAGRLRRRLRTALLAAPAFAAPALLVALAAMAPNHALLRLDDDPHGQRLLVVRERDRGAPTAVVLLGGAPDRTPLRLAVRPAGWWAWTTGWSDAELLLDLEAGELRRRGAVVATFGPGATFVHVTCELGVTAAHPVWSSAPFDAVVRRWQLRSGPGAGGARPGVEVGDEGSAPATLERMLPEAGDGVIERAALGWTTRRCFSARDRAGEALVWGVDAGRVTFVVRSELGERSYLRVVREGMGFEQPGLRPMRGARLVDIEVEDGPRTVKLRSFGEDMSTWGEVVVEDPTLPTDHATLLDVRRRVAAGATVAEALAAAAGNPRAAVPR